MLHLLRVSDVLVIVNSMVFRMILERVRLSRYRPRVQEAKLRYFHLRMPKNVWFTCFAMWSASDTESSLPPNAKKKVFREQNVEPSAFVKRHVVLLMEQVGEPNISWLPVLCWLHRGDSILQPVSEQQWHIFSLSFPVSTIGCRQKLKSIECTSLNVGHSLFSSLWAQCLCFWKRTECVSLHRNLCNWTKASVAFIEWLSYEWVLCTTCRIWKNGG